MRPTSVSKAITITSKMWTVRVKPHSRCRLSEPNGPACVAVTTKVEKVLWAGAQAKCAQLKQKCGTNLDPMHCGDSEREEEAINRYGNAAGFSLVLVTKEQLGYHSNTTLGYWGFLDKLYLKKGASESLYSENHSVKKETEEKVSWASIRKIISRTTKHWIKKRETTKSLTLVLKSSG